MSQAGPAAQASRAEAQAKQLHLAQPLLLPKGKTSNVDGGLAFHNALHWRMHIMQQQIIDLRLRAWQRAATVAAVRPCNPTVSYFRKNKLLYMFVMIKACHALIGL